MKTRATSGGGRSRERQGLASLLAFSPKVPYLASMSRDDEQPRRSALLSFRFLGTALTGSLVMALVSIFVTLGLTTVVGQFFSLSDVVFNIITMTNPM